MNNHTLFQQTIRSYTAFSDEELATLLSYFTEKSFKKNTILLQPGAVAHEAFFVTKGIIRQCFYTEGGTEKTCSFALEGSFITDLESFSRQARSSTALITLEPTTCLSIGCRELVAAMNQSPAVMELFRIVVENVAAENIRRTQSILSLSPERQLEALIAEKPAILQRVPQRYIAQYLGLAPESLSRIRKRMMNTGQQHSKT